MHFILNHKRRTLNEESTKPKELQNKTEEALLNSPPKHQMKCLDYTPSSQLKFSNVLNLFGTIGLRDMTMYKCQL